MLAPSLGLDKAQQLVHAAMRQLGIGSANGQTTLEDSLRILDEIAKEQGLVGITASFVKARLLLRAKNP